jgi:hypothetical protein
MQHASSIYTPLTNATHVHLCSACLTRLPWGHLYTKQYLQVATSRVLGMKMRQNAEVCGDSL